MLLSHVGHHLLWQVCPVRIAKARKFPAIAGLSRDIAVFLSSRSGA